MRAIVMPVRIPAGSALSEPISVEYGNVEGVFMPADMEGTSISFRESWTLGGPFVDMRDELKGEVMVSFDAGTSVCFDPIASELRGVLFLQIRIGSALSPSTQSEERILRLKMKGQE